MKRDREQQALELIKNVDREEQAKRRIAKGEAITKIAEDLNISRATIYTWQRKWKEQKNEEIHNGL